MSQNLPNSSFLHIVIGAEPAYLWVLSHLHLTWIFRQDTHRASNQEDYRQILVVFYRLVPVYRKSYSYLKVPQRSDMMPEDARLFSPPPRRCSNFSAYSENSTISDSNLLSPAMYSNSTRSNSFASASYSYSDDNETPPNEFLSVLRPHSTQVES